MDLLSPGTPCNFFAFGLGIPAERWNKTRRIVPPLVTSGEALSFSQFVSLIEGLGSGNQLPAAVNAVFTRPIRSFARLFVPHRPHILVTF